MAYFYLIISPKTLTSARVFGLLLSNLHILVTCCCTVVGLVPYCEKLLLEYNPVVSVVSVGSLALFTNYTGVTGLAVHNSFVANILAYDVLWLLEDCPLRAYLPLHLVVVAIHFASQQCLSTSWSLPVLALTYLGLGLVVPVIASGLLLPSDSQARVPRALHTVISATVVGYLLFDQLLRAPLLTEPLQDMAAADGGLLLRGVVSMLEPRKDGAQYRYGLAEHTGLGLMYSTLALSLVSAVLSALSDTDGGALNGLAHRTFLASLSKNSAAWYLLAMLRGMSASKKAAVVGIAAMLMLQLLGMASVAFEVAVRGPESLVQTAPTVLLGVMMGCILQVGCVLYILLGPSDTDGPAATMAGATAAGAAGTSLETTAPATVAISEMETVSRSTSVGGGMMTPGTTGAGGGGGGGARSLLTRANVMAQDGLLDSSTVHSGQNASGGAVGMMDSYSMLSGLSRGPSERLSAVDTVDDNALDLRNRIEALGNFKTFMQGLDQQPGVYLLEEFIRGAATAIRGIFPGVAHASFCLLNQTRNCVNMYTFLGDGSRKPPRINVTVAPGTLIYHVLHNCQPVFISNVAAFPGPYADVQFMRFVLNLRSVACLPLVVAGSRVLGVLRLGFEEQWNWTEQEKGIAKQLALVLSSTSNGMHVYGGGAMQPMPGMGIGVGGVGVAGLGPAGSGASGLFDSQEQEEEEVAAAAAAAMAAAKYPNVAAFLTANNPDQQRSGGSAPQALMPDDLDGGLSYARTQPLGAPLQPQSLQHLYSSGSVGPGSGAMGGSGGAGGPVPSRRMRQMSRSSLQYSGGPYQPGMHVGPGGGGGNGSGTSNGPEAGLGVGAQAGLGPGSSSRSSVDVHLYYSGMGGPGGPIGQQQGYGDMGLGTPLGMAQPAGMGPMGPIGMGGPMGIGPGGMQGMAAGGMAAGGMGMAAAPAGGVGPTYAGAGVDPYAGYAGSAYGGVAGGGGMVSMQSNLSSGGGLTAPRQHQDSSGSGQQLTANEIDETWLLQQPGSAQVRRALAKPAQAQGHGAGADIKMLEVIGRGGFGSVYKAFWRGMVVAVKVLEHEDEMLPCSGGSGSQTKVDTSSRRAALLEGAMTSTISHPHVVQTYDYRVVTLDPQSSLNGITRSRVLHETHIIMEFCDRGSLQDAIEQGVFVADGPRGARSANAEPEIDMELIIMTLAEVSTAMEYLHKHRITHRDLKPKNILLRSSSKDRRGYVSKVSDFGLSQVLPDTNKTQVSTKYSGTVTHMAPELIEDGKVYQQGDVYAFGIIMWEIYTSTTPYQNMAHPQIMVGVVTHNLRPKFPNNCPEWYKNLAYRCWRKDPKTRPSFTEVTKTLLGMLSDKDWRPS